MKTTHLRAAATVVAILGLNSLGHAGPLGGGAMSGGLSGGLGGGINRGGLNGNFNSMATGASTLNAAQKAHEVTQSTRNQVAGTAQGAKETAGAAKSGAEQTAGAAKSGAQETATSATSTAQSAAAMDASHGPGNASATVGSSLNASGAISQ
jgi:hypothetical protein